MDWERQCVAVIPCLNEAATIAEVVAGVHRYLLNVIVVDDGSSDGTSEKASAAGSEVLTHSRNRGKGAALRTGCQRAHDRNCAWALLMDGDGQHAPEDIPAFLARAEKTGAALVIGDRMGHAGEMPWLRRQVNRWMTDRLAKFTGVPLPDSQCGFRLVNLDALSGLKLSADRFEIESEMLLAFLIAGHRVEFVPVQVIYKSQPSKIHPLLDTCRWIRWWWRQKNS